MTIFLTAFVVSLLLTPVMIRLGRRFGLVDHPGGRRKHQGDISRIGGVAIFGGFMAGFALIFWQNPPPTGSHEAQLLTGVLLGSLLVFGYGLLDDIYDLPPRYQFAVQFVAALLAIYFTIFIEEVTLPFVGFVRLPLFIVYPVTIFWVMGMLNTVNFLDGLDGLAAGVAAIAALMFAYHAYSLGQFRIYLFPLALAGASLGFLPFNFAPAKVFMGSVGSMTLGWALASLSILAPAKVATALLVLGIPIIDVAWLFLYRWRTKGSPLTAGRDHLHFRLLDMGLSQRNIVLGYYAFATIFGLLALFVTSRTYKFIALVALTGATFIVLWQLARAEPNV